MFHFNSQCEAHKQQLLYQNSVYSVNGDDAAPQLPAQILHQQRARKGKMLRGAAEANLIFDSDRRSNIERKYVDKIPLIFFALSVEKKTMNCI